MANSPVIGGSHSSSSGSHLVDDVYITGSLSQIPVSPTASLHEWALDREDSQSPVPVGDHMRKRCNTSPLQYTHVRTISPHPPSVAVTHRRSSPDPYCVRESRLQRIDSSNDVIIGPSPKNTHNLSTLDGNKSSSYTLLDHTPHEQRSCSANNRTTLLQHRAVSSPSLDHVGDHNEVLLQQPQSTNSNSYNHDLSGRTVTCSGRRGSKLSLEDLTRIEPCRDVKKKSHDEQSNGHLLDTNRAEKPQTLSPIEDGRSPPVQSQELSLSGNTSSEVSCHRSNKKSYSSQRERLHRSLSKPLTGGTSQSASSQGSYSFDYSLSSDHISGKSPTVTTDTSQMDSDSNTGSQEFTRQRASSFKKYLENSLHEAFHSLEDDEEEPTDLEVKSVQHSQEDHVRNYGAAKLSPGNDHVVNHLSREANKGFSPGASPKKPHRIMIHDDSVASQPFQMEHSRSHTITRVFSDSSFHEHKNYKSTGSIFAVSCLFTCCVIVVCVDLFVICF